MWCFPQTETFGSGDAMTEWVCLTGGWVGGGDVCIGPVFPTASAAVGLVFWIVVAHGFTLGAGGMRGRAAPATTTLTVHCAIIGALFSCVGVICGVLAFWLTDAVLVVSAISIQPLVVEFRDVVMVFICE